MRFSIRTKLLAAIGLDLALMMALGAFAIMQMNTMNAKASFVENHTIPSMDTVDRINDILTNYRALQVEYLINISAADKARIERDMIGAERQMSAALASYESFVSSDAERATLDRLKTLWADFVDATHRGFIPANRNNNTGTVQPSFSRLTPLYRQLGAAAQEITRLNQERATEALSVVRASYDTSRRVILTETIATLIVTSLVGLLLSGSIARRIAQLRDATVVVAGGDLDRTVRLRGSDELVLLADNFNQMVVSLRRQRALLEQRNDELAASLEMQRALMDDLVRRKQAEEAAHRAQAAAEAASQAKSMFLATMSHELRTPLNAILGYVQLLHLDARMRGRSELLPDLERIRAAGKHLLTIINNILDFSKIEQGRMDVDIDTFDIADLAFEVGAIIEPLARGRNTLVIDVSPVIGTMRSDAGKLRQVLFNLLSNAVKFTENGTVTLRISRDASAGADLVCFAVIDTGIGITSEQMKRLFRPFSQADAATTRRYGGTGLGLALSHQLCQILGGGISVESTPGKGSTFTVVVPADIGAAEAARAPADAGREPQLQLDVVERR